MRQAFQLAHKWLKEWTEQHEASYPPIVINITDGAADEDPSDQAQVLASISTRDGNVLLFNCHISDRKESPILFPHDEACLPDSFATSLFRMSSLLPDGIRSAAEADGFPLNNSPRGFAFNADFVELIKFLDIGTRPSNMR